MVNLGDDGRARAALLKSVADRQIPVLEDDERGAIVPESSIVIEFLDRHFPAARVSSLDGDAGLQMRLRDRFYDLLCAHADAEDRRRPSGCRLDKKGIRMVARAWVRAQLASCSAW